MGLASFFERASQSAAQVLRRFNPTIFEQKLEAIVVTLAFDGTANTPEGAAILDMAARLVARLYPRVAVVAINQPDDAADSLRDLMRSINPNIEFANPSAMDRHVAIVVGSTPFMADTSIYAGSNGWIAEVSTAGPVTTGDSFNPFGAGAAACLASANLFRAVFADQLEKPELDGHALISLLNFETGIAARNAHFETGIDIGLVQLVGVGAIGNGFVWAASRLRDVAGHVHCIDHETIETSNLQRYVMGTAADVDGGKAFHAAELVRGGSLDASAFTSTWAGYIDAIGHQNFECVAVALDTARDRTMVQGSLPRMLYNAWTQVGDLGISRHGFDGPEACLACLYLPTTTRRNEDQIVAQELGLSENHLLELRTMLHLGTPVGEAFVRHVAQTTGTDEKALLAFANLPLRAFRQRAICGNLVVRAGDGGTTDLDVPLAFQSAMAGVMLAAEIVADASHSRQSRPGTRTVMNLMRRLPESVTSTVLKKSPLPTRCICQDDDYIGAYRAKYAAIG